MRQAALLSAMFFIFVSLVFGQSANTANSDSNNSQAVSNGVTTPSAPTTPLVVRTPEVNLSNVQLSAGASNATAGNQAGATNATANNQAGAANSTSEPAAATTPEVPTSYNASSGVRSYGPTTDSAWQISSEGQDLASASRDARMHLAKDHPRVYNNEDIARFHNNGAATGNGNMNTNAGPVTNQSTMPASDVMPSQNTSQPASQMQQSPQAQQPNTMPPPPVRSPFRPKTAPEQAPQQPQSPQ